MMDALIPACEVLNASEAVSLQEAAEAAQKVFNNINNWVQLTKSLRSILTGRFIYNRFGSITVGLV